MEKFIRGYHSDDEGRKVILKLPGSRQLEILRNEETGSSIRKIQLLIKQAVRISYKPRLKLSHGSPDYVRSGEEVLENFDSLQNILGKHPFPLSQGPVILPVDSLTNQRTDEEELTSKTKFMHSDSQSCYEWIPLGGGLIGWGYSVAENSFIKKEEESYLAKDLSHPIEGTASCKDKRDHLYTCQFHKCIIHCPCTICYEQNKTESEKMKNETVNESNKFSS